MPDLLPFVVSGLGMGAVYALSGVGLVVLYRACGVLNFAFGALGALAAFVAWSALAANWSPVLAWSLAVAAAMVISLIYGRLLAPALAHRDSSIRSVGTLGLALVVLGLTQWWWGDQPRRLLLPTDDMVLSLAHVRLTYTRLLGLLLALWMVLAVGLLLAKTRLGLKMRALADDRQLSAMLGIAVLRVDSLAWLLSGALAGVSGLLLANIVRLDANLLTFLVIPAMAAAILGRLRSLTWTVLGGIGIGVLEAVAIVLPGFASFRTATPFLVALIAIAFYRAEVQPL